MAGPRDRIDAAIARAKKAREAGVVIKIPRSDNPERAIDSLTRTLSRPEWQTRDRQLALAISEDKRVRMALARSNYTIQEVRDLLQKDEDPAVRKEIRKTIGRGIKAPRPLRGGTPPAR